MKRVLFALIILKTFTKDFITGHIMRDTMGYLRLEDLHVAQIGTGRVGRPTAYTILCAGLAGTMTVCDTKPGLATAFAEELRHVAVSLGLDVKINSCEKAISSCQSRMRFLSKEIEHLSK